jgi:hypothetical protein
VDGVQQPNNAWEEIRTVLLPDSVIIAGILVLEVVLIARALRIADHALFGIRIACGVNKELMEDHALILELWDAL